MADATDTRFTPPAILRQPQIVRPLPWRSRLGVGAGGIACMVVMGLSLWLRPDASGHGTHEQLGLAACQTLRVTGRPCPSCGMTTAFAWFAHGHPVRSFLVQPAGAFLAFLTLVLGWTGLYVLVTGTPAHRMLLRVLTLPVIIGIALILLGGWAWTLTRTP